MGDFGQTLDGRMRDERPFDEQPQPAAFSAEHEIHTQHQRKSQLMLSSFAGPPSVRAPTGALRVLERERPATPVPGTAQAPRRSRTTLWIALVGALAYNSWPLAFLVNPTLAGSALASSFEGHSQPFSWLFILLDCVAGLCTAIVCVRELRPRRGRNWPGWALAFSLLAYGMFGMATAVDAVVPLNCGSASAQACASQLWPLTPDDMLTGTAIFGLFMATALVVYQMMRRPVAFRLPVTVGLGVVLIGWTVLGVTVLVSNTSPTIAAASQYGFITLTSILAFVVPLGATVSRRRWAESLAAQSASSAEESSIESLAAQVIPYGVRIADQARLSAPATNCCTCSSSWAKAGVTESGTMRIGARDSTLTQIRAIGRPSDRAVSLTCCTS
jgi:hypothetical protein